MGRAARLAAVVVLALGLGACGDDEPDTKPSSGSPSTGSSPSKASESPTASPTDKPPARPSGGTADDPAVAEAAPDVLDWSPVPGSVDDTVTVSGRWSLGYPQQGDRAVLDGPDPVTVTAPKRFRIADTLIDGEYAVVVAQDELETKPSVATVIDLATGKKATLDGSSDVPTTNGGTWALGGGTVAHATIGKGRSYCLATVDLASQDSTLGWCAPPRNGFNDARITPAGTSLLTFDDKSPSCRTVAQVDGDRVTPFPDVPDCKGWDGALLDDGAVWSVVAKENRVEEADFFARVGDGYFDLGPGTSGSLTPCGGSAYFVRDPQRSADPARLMRWSPDGELTVAYETAARGQATLSEPRCGGETVTVTALTAKGDEQVSAPAG
jgi:hypothetical protein